MHKDVEVLKGKYDFERHSFREIEVFNEKHLPVGTVTDGVFSLKKLNSWIHWRGIPGYRVGLMQLMERLQIKEPLELLEKAHMLSVSDCYWLKEEGEEVSWKDINFFHHSFDDKGFGTVMFARIAYDAPASARKTPNNTTAGYHRKAWLIQNGQLVLAKGGSAKVQEEPVNEWLAGQIAQRLGIDAVHYDLGIYEDQLVCLCPAMTNEHTDLVSAKDVMRGVKVPKGEFSAQYYLDELASHGITDGEEKLSDMCVLDYLMMNTDRHNQNLGILVDADTMEWKKWAPVFDTGTGLACLKEDDEVAEEEEQQDCQLFNAKGFSHEELLPFIDFRRYDFTGLQKLADDYGNQLVKYQRNTNISNRRIEDLYRLFYKRVLRIQKAASGDNR